MINNVSQKFLDIVKGDGRTFRAKIVINDKEYTEFRELKLTKSCESGDSLSFGSCFSSSLTATIPNFPKNIAIAQGKITLYVGLKIDTSLDSFDDLNAYEWVKLGTFNISESKFNDDELKITAYDNFYLCEKVFASNLSGLQKIKTIVNEQCSKLGITYIDDIEDVSYNIDVLKGLTIREAFSYLASYLGKNAIFNEDGKLQFIWYSKINKIISADRFTSPLTVGEYDTVINSITCITKESITNENGGIETKDKNITVGSGDGITFSNLYMTEVRLNALLNKIKGFTFRSCEMNWIVAEPNVQIGDIVTIEDLEHVYTVPIMNMEMSFDGGCNATIKSKYKVKEADRFEGSLSKKVERNYQEYASFKEVIAEKVTAFEGDFTKVNTDILNVNKELIAVKGSIKDLNVDELVTRVATIETSYVNKQYVNENYVGIQYANTTYAVKSEVKDLTADVAKINTLLSGSVTAGSTQTIVLNAENTTIANALIKSANIESVNADIINSGTLNTNLVQIQSQDGGVKINGNTQQFLDKNNKVRVQIGRDAQNNFNFLVVGEDGKTAIFNENGITKNAVPNGLIVDQMVSDGANIQGKKINITSLITEINGNSTMIESSHIKYDGKSLDIAFDSIQTSVSTVTKTITDNKSKWDTASTNASNALNKASSVETRANNGEFDGRGVGTTSIAYQASSNGTVAPTGAWTSTIPSVPAGQYLWTRTMIIYTDKTTDYIYTVAKMGANGTNGSKGDKGDTGATGNGISSITSYYLASASASGVTVSTSGWTTTPQSVSTSKKYHWSYQIITYTNGSKTTTTPAIIGVYGDTGAQGATGATGKGIKSVTPQYYLSTSNTTQSGGSWKTTQDTWSSGKYYWTRDSIVWSDNTTTYTTPTLDVGLNTANANALNAITKVTTVEETVKTQSTQITTAQGQISTLITDVTQAKKDITATKGDVTTAKANITTLTNNYSSIKQTVDGLNSTVGSHTSQLTTIKGTADSALSLINNLSIGGRNYIVLGKITSYTPYNTAPTVSGNVLTSTWNASYTGITFTIAISGFSPKNKVYTLSGYLKVNGAIPTAKYFIDKASTYGSSLQRNEYDPKTGYFVITQTYSGSNNWILHGSTTRKSGSTDVVTIEKLKFEEGNKATDWTPAPEDVDTSIFTVDGRVTAEIKKVTDKQSVFENTINGIASRVSSTETKVTTLTTTANNALSNANNAISKANTANLLAIAMSNGKLVKKDVNFKTGTNGIGTYNNSGGTDVAITRIAKPADCPSTSGYALQIKHIGTKASPGYGGFIQGITARASAHFVVKYLIKLPTGYTLNTASNTMGNGYVDRWLTSNVGTNKYEIYVREVICGTSGTFSSGGHVYVGGGTAPSASAPLTWYVAGIWQYDITDCEMDYDSAISSINKEITSTKSTVAEHSTKLDSITSRVSTTETNITNINGNITSLTTRMSTAEQKVTDSAIVATVTKSSNWTTLDTKATDAQTKANNLVDLTTIKDTRNANNNPQWYFTNYPKKTVREFKNCSTVGISNDGLYGTLETTTSWAESSGGYPVQLFYPNNSQNIYRRVGTSTTAWGAWTKVAGTHNAISIINQTAEQIKIQASKISLEGVVTANQYFKINTDGSMEATSGKIAGFTIDSAYIQNTSKSVGMGTTADWAFWAGGSSNPTFRVKSDGSLYASKATITGGMVEMSSRRTVSVTNADADKIMNYIVGRGTLTDAEKNKFDINQDGRVTAVDYTLCRQIANGNLSGNITDFIKMNSNSKTRIEVGSSISSNMSSIISGGSISTNYLDAVFINLRDTEITPNGITYDKSSSKNMGIGFGTYNDSYLILDMHYDDGNSRYNILSYNTQDFITEIGSYNKVVYSSGCLCNNYFALQNAEWIGFYNGGGIGGWRKAWIGHDRGTAFTLWNEAGEDFYFRTTQGWLRAYATNGDGCFNFRTDLSTFWFAQQVSVAGLINRSREKYKTNIVEFDNALKLINSSTVYEYNLKEELQKGTKQQHYGFIIERETPQEIINGDGVDVYSLASINWQGTKELAHITNVRLTMHDQEIQELKNENARLQQELKNTQAKLDAFISGNFEFKTVTREVI